MTSTELEQAPQIERAIAPGALPTESLARQEETLAMLWREAKALSAGKMFKDVTQADQAFAKLVIGHHLGLTPAQSMTGIDIVKGNPQLRGVLLGTLVRSHPGYDWKVKEMGPESVSIEFFRGGESQGVSTWTKADSDRAGLSKDDSNHAKYPTAMFWNRAMSQGVKLLVPETMRGIPVYVEEDLEGLPAGGAHNGELGEISQRSPLTDLAALERAIRTHLPEDLIGRAESDIKEMNSLAPNSWTASKIEMVFKDKKAYAASAELAQIEKAIEELRARPEATTPEAAEEVVEAEVVEAGSDSSPSNEGTKEEPEADVPTCGAERGNYYCSLLPAHDGPHKAEGDNDVVIKEWPAEERVQDTGPAADPDAAIPARPRSLEEETLLVRQADLRDELEDDNLSDDARSAIEAEIDSISGELPPDIGEGQTELGL